MKIPQGGLITRLQHQLLGVLLSNVPYQVLLRLGMEHPQGGWQEGDASRGVLNPASAPGGSAKACGFIYLVV